MNTQSLRINIITDADEPSVKQASNFINEQFKDIKLDFSGAFAKSILQALDSFKLIADNVTKMMQDLENTT